MFIILKLPFHSQLINFIKNIYIKEIAYKIYIL